MIKNFFFCVCLAVFSLHAQEPAIKTEVSAVVFDFGGVIAQADTANMSNFLMNSFQINKDELSQALRTMQGFVADGGSEKQYWEAYALIKGVVLPEDWCEQFGKVINESITAIPGTIAIVKALQDQGYQTAMLSDITQYQAAIVRKMGYYDLFQPVLLSYAIGVKKPSPEAFKILLNELQLPASRVLFIDDRIENVEAARKLGIDAIQFLSPEQLQEEIEMRGIRFNESN